MAERESRPTILLADPHPLTRQGVRETLEASGFAVCAEAVDAAGAVEAALRLRPDLCLLEVQMPGSGIRAARRITAELPDTAVVMLTASREDGDLFDALRAGAAGYLLKETAPERLPHALRGVLAGESALPRTLVARLIDEFRSQGRRRRVPGLGRRTAELSEREWQTLELMRDGHSTAEIADRLHVSPVTVRRHISSVLAKLGVPDRAAALELLEAQHRRG